MTDSNEAAKSPEDPNPTPAPPPRRKFSTVWTGLIALLVLLLAGFALLAIYVDDWGRDLTTNHAETTANHTDPQLRSIVTRHSLEQATERTLTAIESLQNWEVVETEAGESDTTIQATRTTALMKYVDDITVTIREADDEVLIEAESQSRTGRADLGQNPRNLRELTAAVRDQLDQ